MSEKYDLEAYNTTKELMGASFFKLVDTYLANAEKHVAAVVSGFEARDAKVIEDSAHPLKSSSANMGIAKLSAVAQEMEDIARSLQDEDGNGEAGFESLGGLVSETQALLEDARQFFREDAA